jgi:hypothetical protein
LSQIAGDPLDNPYRTAVRDFYDNVKKSPHGTKGYINYFDEIETSSAVFYLANHVVSTYSVDAKDRQVWRQGLIDRLAQVDDASSFPVMALGLATWALAQTGSLDKTLIDPALQGTAYWHSKTLKDLPDLLISHQVSEEQPHAGSFYWQFYHDQGDPNGYTEDTIFATLGLIVASRENLDPKVETRRDLDEAVLAARNALLNGISADGRVWEHLSRKGVIFYAYAGEMLQVLSQLAPPRDLNLDGCIDSSDFAILADHWFDSICEEENAWCAGSDLDRNGHVDFIDLEMMVDYWLQGVER